MSNTSFGPGSDGTLNPYTGIYATTYAPPPPLPPSTTSTYFPVVPGAMGALPPTGMSTVPPPMLSRGPAPGYDVGLMGMGSNTQEYWNSLIDGTSGLTL